MTKIGLLGDTHGNGRWTVYALSVFQTYGIEKIVQLGDFGISNTQSGHLFLKKVRLGLKNYKQTMYVIPGNHEDYDYIESIPVGEDGWQALRAGIKLAPRGLRWSWGDTSFVALGGAPSVDRQYRLNAQRGGNKMWWDQESITRADVDNVVAGGYADVMLTHDAPNCAQINGRIKGNPMGFEQADLHYASEGRALMEEAFRGVAPKALFHGHYHFVVNDTSVVHRDSKDQMASIVGLNCDGFNGSMATYDTETREVTFIDISQHKP